SVLITFALILIRSFHVVVYVISLTRACVIVSARTSLTGGSAARAGHCRPTGCVPGSRPTPAHAATALPAPIRAARGTPAAGARSFRVVARACGTARRAAP